MDKEVDILSVRSEFTTGILSKLLCKWIKTKLKKELDIEIKNIDAGVRGDKVKIHLDGNVEMSKKELLNILANAGL